MTLLTDNNSTPPPASSTPPPAGNPPAQTSWRDSLPEDLKGNASLSKFSDVANLAKAYVHAESSIGKKGVIVPGEKSTDEDWENFYNQIGRPEKDKYSFDLPKDKKLNDETIGKFKEVAFKSGILPKQAKALVDWFSEHEENTLKNVATERENAHKLGIDNLKKEWGQGYDKEIGSARVFMKEVGGDEFKQYLESTGLGNDPVMIKFLAKAGKLLGEDKIRGEAGDNRMGMTPDEIQKEIANLSTNPEYTDASHPKHKLTVEKVAQLYQKLHP
jgi:hypothetical protein